MTQNMVKRFHGENVTEMLKAAKKKKKIWRDMIAKTQNIALLDCRD